MYVVWAMWKQYSAARAGVEGLGVSDRRRGDAPIATRRAHRLLPSLALRSLTLERPLLKQPIDELHSPLSLLSLIGDGRAVSRGRRSCLLPPLLALGQEPLKQRSASRGWGHEGRSGRRFF